MSLMAEISQDAHAVGLDNAVPVLLAVLTLARAVDALIRQPAPGSHWLPLRKMVSVIAFSVLHAKPGEQPPLVTWLQRLLVVLAQYVPPAPPVAPAAPRAEPQLGPAAPPVLIRPAPVQAPAVAQAATTSVSAPATSPVEAARAVLGATPTETITFAKP